MKHKGKVIVIAVDDIDEGSVALIVAAASAVSEVKAAEVFNGDEIRISRVCPVYTMDQIPKVFKEASK